MRVGFTFTVRFVAPESGLSLQAPKFEHQHRLSDLTLDAYLDKDLADEGIVGGELYLKQINPDEPAVEVLYWYPGTLSSESIHALELYTVAQLQDGIGEGGLEFEFAGIPFLAMVNTDEPPVIDHCSDGRAVLDPPGIAIAARDGDLTRLEAELALSTRAINQLHQGCPALHLAILFGQQEAIRILLDAGADPNSVDSDGITPLEACALTNAFNDEQSYAIALMLLEAGADRSHQTPDGGSARRYAESRGKSLLAMIL